MQKVEYQNWSIEIFQGFYESELYNSDTEYSFNANSDDEQGFELQDWEGFTQAVAKAHADLLFDNLEQKEQIITAIEYKGLCSPKYYNFETDKLELIIECDIEALKGYCFNNYKDFDTYLHENFTSCDGFISFVPNNVQEFASRYKDDTERLLNVMIEYYLLRNLDLETYRYATVEYAQDCLYDHMKPVEQEDKPCSE
jgi:hypothetical protein